LTLSDRAPILKPTLPMEIFMTRVRLLLFVAVILALAAPAQAAKPDIAFDTPNADRVFWFVQTGDLRIGRDGPDPQDNLEWLLGDLVPAIAPDFVVLCGNLVDGTNGENEPAPPYQQEWNRYKQILEDAGADSSLVYDLVGSREAWNDPGFSLYLANSVQGRATGDFRHAWMLSFEWGDYLFIGAPTVDATGPAYPEEPVLVVDETIEWLETWSFEALNSRMLFVWGHFPLYFPLPWPGETKFYHWIVDNGGAAYGSGHFPHAAPDEATDYFGDLLRVNGGGLGFDEDLNYTIWVVDNDGVSLAGAKVGTYPIVISSPLNKALGGGNERAYVLAAGAPSVHVRAVAFSPEPPNKLTGLVEGLGLEFDLTKVNGRIYQGEFEATAITAGDVQITVSGNGLAAQTITVEFGTTACFDGVDNEGDGDIDFPDDAGCASYSDSSEIGDTPPVADAGEDQTAAADTAIFFDGLGSYDPDEYEPLRYIWRFGDEDSPETYADNPFVSHVYEQPGVYEATLTVIDTRANRDRDTVRITVTEGDDDESPEAPDDDDTFSDDLTEEDDTDYGCGCAA
jgi:hypothetical protein